MPVEYEVDKQVAEVVDKILTFHELRALTTRKIKILCIAKIEADEDGELKECKRGREIMVQKATPFDAVFTDAKLFVVVNRYWWDSVEAERREAELFNHLLRMDAVENKAGELKISKREWDWQLMVQAVQRYPIWTPIGLEIFEAMRERHTLSLPRVEVHETEVSPPAAPDTAAPPQSSGEVPPEPEQEPEPEPERPDRPAVPVRRIGAASRRPVNNPSAKS